MGFVMNWFSGNSNLEAPKSCVLCVERHILDLMHMPWLLDWCACSMLFTQGTHYGGIASMHVTCNAWLQSQIDLETCLYHPRRRCDNTVHRCILTSVHILCTLHRNP